MDERETMCGCFGGVTLCGGGELYFGMEVRDYLRCVYSLE